MYAKLSISMQVKSDYKLFLDLLYTGDILEKVDFANNLTQPVDAVNRRTRFECHRSFVVNQNFKKDRWFSETPVAP